MVKGLGNPATNAIGVVETNIAPMSVTRRQRFSKSVVGGDKRATPQQ